MGDEECFQIHIQSQQPCAGRGVVLQEQNTASQFSSPLSSGFSGVATSVKVVNPCLILGYNSLDKITGIIFKARLEIPRHMEPSPFPIIGQHSRHQSCKNL